MWFDQFDNLIVNWNLIKRRWWCGWKGSGRGGSPRVGRMSWKMLKRLSLENVQEKTNRFQHFLRNPHFPQIWFKGNGSKNSDFLLIQLKDYFEENLSLFPISSGFHNHLKIPWQINVHIFQIMFLYLHGGKGRWTGKVCWGKSEVIPQTLVDIQFYVWRIYIVKRYT